MMPTPPPEPQAAVFTAGFSTLPLDPFLANLRAYDIAVLADVRALPVAALAPHFDMERIGPAVRAAGLKYRYLGRELGGEPDDPALYDAEGHALYGRIAAQPWFQLGLGLVLDDLRRGRRVALACVEDDPRLCHRRLLVGRALREQGIGVAHILPGGGLIAEAELLDEEGLDSRLLPPLHGGEWRSPSPVPRQHRPHHKPR
jgi:uncharacterized protein (DUF488 family)